MGARGRPAPRPVRRPARPGPLLDRAVRRHGDARGSISASITTSFAAEQTLTSDTVPVNVDAVLFWMVYDPEKAALEVQDYAAGRQLGGADGAARHHRPHVAHRSAARPRADRGGAAEADRPALEPVGRDRAVGRDARRRHPGRRCRTRCRARRRPSREKQARIILGQAEVEIAHSFEEAVEVVPATTRRRCTCAR